MGSIIQTDQIVANISQQFPVDIAVLSFLFNRRFLDAMEDDKLFSTAGWWKYVFTSKEFGKCYCTCIKN